MATESWNCSSLSSWRLTARDMVSKQEEAGKKGPHLFPLPNTPLLLEPPINHTREANQQGREVECAGSAFWDTLESR